MPDKKKQHFVPQFYLRNFSIDCSRKRLGIFNIDKSKFISDGNLKNQAYKNYFYGHDLTIEDALSEQESRTAKIIQKIIDQDSIAFFTQAEHYYFLEFAIVLRERTAYSFDGLNESADKLLKAIISKDPSAPKNIDIDEANISFANPTGTALYQAVISLAHAFDLAYKLVVNKTQMPFITSDHPVVFYNQFLENKHIAGSNTGMANKGLQVILPLSPQHIIIFFDKDVYKIGGRNKSSINDITDSDVIAFNQLQYLNAKHNLYFNRGIQESQIKNLANRNARYRRKEKVSVDQYLVEVNDGKDHDLLHYYSCDIKCKFKVSFIHTLKKARKHKLKENNLFAPVRDENFCRQHNKFMKLVEKGEYKANEFFSYKRMLETNPYLTW